MVACANAKTNPSQEFDPNVTAGAAGSGEEQGGAGGAGETGGQGGSAGSAAGQGGSGASQAGASGSTGSPGQGGSGGAAGKGGSGGTSASGGSAGAGNAGGTGGSSGQGGSGQGAGLGGSGGSGGSGGLGGGGAGGDTFGGSGGAGGSGAGGSGGAGGAGGSGGSGGSGGAPGGSSGSGGQPFGGTSAEKTCPNDPAGGNGGSGGGLGVPGGFCPAEKLGNPNDDPCYDCWNASRAGQCKDLFDACEASPSCVDFFTCFSTCAKEEDKCFDTCAQSTPEEGKFGFAAVRDCIYYQACPAACHDQCIGVGSTNRCNHDVCTTGYDLDPDCNECAQTVCDSDSICCNLGWDNSCKTKAEKLCGISCDNPIGGCVHSECATGAPLTKGCSPCADKVCAAHPLCCSPLGKWDLACAEAADAMCP